MAIVLFFFVVSLAGGLICLLFTVASHGADDGQRASGPILKAGVKTYMGLLYRGSAHRNPILYFTYFCFVFTWF